MESKQAVRLCALGLAAGMVLAACSSGGEQGDGGQADGKPKRGGTLKLVGGSDVTSFDTAFSYYTLNYVLQRGMTRQLVTVPGTDDPKKAGRIVADMATKLPTKDNGGISNGGKTYTFTIKKGVKWNTDPPRQVTAQDMERGIERLCNPAYPSGALSYYTGTIKGMAEFCDGLSKVKPKAGPIADYIKGHDISGIVTKDKRTVVFNLITPTPDFLNIMAEYFATPAPKEYLQYVPNSREFNQNVLSNGPYQLETYKPDNEILLTRNPAWDPKTDNVRNAYVDKIHVQEGVNQQSAFQQVYSGTADMMWSQPPPTSKLPSLYGDPRLELTATGLINNYVVFNMVSPNSNGATGKLKVRQAVAYAVDKSAIIQIYGGPKIGTKACQVLPKTSKGHIPDFDCLYSTGDHKKDQQKAKQLLKQAGYGDGLTLKMIYRNEGNHIEVAQALQQDLKQVGITLKLKPVPSNDFYSQYLQNPSQARKGVWDITAPGWIPDWQGLNGRAFLQPLFYSANIKKSGSSWGTNYGFYDSDKFNKLIKQATTASSEQQAVELFTQAQKQVVKDLAIVPTNWQKQPQLHSKRVKNFQGYPNATGGDITNIWLEQ